MAQTQTSTSQTRFPESLLEKSASTNLKRFWSVSGWRLDVLCIAGIVGLIGIYKWLALADYDAPPGPDPGNWLRMAHAVVGERSQAAETTYPPVLPALLRFLLLFFEPLFAVKLLGVAVSTLPAAPVFMILRRHLSAGFAAALAATAVLTGYQEETFSWGGYSQLLSVAFLLFALYALDSWLSSSRRSDLWLSAACTALAVGTSHLVAASLVPILGLYWLMAGPLRMSIRGHEDVSGFKTWAAMVVGLCLFAAPWYIYMAFLTAGGATPVREELWALSAYKFVFRESQLFWLVLFGASIALAFIGKDSRLVSLRRLFGCLLFGSLIAFAISGEARYLQIAQLGIIFSVGYVIACADGLLECLEGGYAKRAGWAVLACTTAAFVYAVAIPGDNRLHLATTYYRTVDTPAKDALDYLRTGTPPRSVIIAGTNQRGMPYGWWIEGYAQRPTLIDMDPDLLFFSNERRQVEMVRRMLDPGTPDPELRQLLEAYRVGYVFIDRDTGAQYEALLSRLEHCVVFDNERFTVARLGTDGAGCDGS